MNYITMDTTNDPGENRGVGIQNISRAEVKIVNFGWKSSNEVKRNKMLKKVRRLPVNDRIHIPFPTVCY